MTIYGVGYRALQYVPEPVWKRLRPLAAIEFGGLFRSRWGIALFFLCLGPSLVSLFIMLGHVGVLQIEGLPGSGQMGQQLRHQLAANTHMQRFWPDHVRFYLVPVIEESLAPFLILTTLISSRAIAKDHAANALELSWTRGISPRGYFLAKWLGSAGPMLLAGIGASLLLWIMGVVMWSDWSLLETTWNFMPRTLLALVLFTVVVSYLPVALSALANTANMGSILWIMLVMGSGAVGLVMSQVMHDQSWLPSVSVWSAAGTVARSIAGLSERPETVRGAVINLSVIVAVLTVLMVRRLRLKEAIG